MFILKGKDWGGGGEMVYFFGYLYQHNTANILHTK